MSKNVLLSTRRYVFLQRRRSVLGQPLVGRRMASSTPSLGKTAVVTGSSRGIGRAIAIRLAQDGYDVCVHDLEALGPQVNEVVKEVEALGRRAIGHTADVTSRAQVDGLVKAAVDKLGPLSTMVANAGIVQVKPLLEVTEEDNNRMFAVNYHGVFNCYAAAAKQMLAQGTPPDHPPRPGVPVHSKGVYKCIAAASIVAFKPFPLLSPYSASKFAVRGLTQAFSMELAGQGITFNAYAPGIVGTKMWDQIDEEVGRMRGVKKGDTIEKYSRELIALGRTSVPEDVSNLVSFLAGRDSDYMTGQTVIVDGGIINN